MSLINEYLLKLAYDELGFYRFELRQNWVAPLQAGVLVVTVPYLIECLLPRVLAVCRIEVPLSKIPG